MTPATEQFLVEVLPSLKAADLAVLNGDAEPRIALWTTEDPADWLGQFGTRASGAHDVAEHFRRAAQRFTEGSLLQYDVVSADVVGDAACLVTAEHVRVGIDGGEPVAMTQRVSRVLRREDGEWRCAHGHADLDPATLDIPWQPPRR